MLEFKGVSKSYPGKPFAVRDLNLKVNAGDVYGFIGHNGAGKTTAIRCAVGVLGFEQGDIFVDGVSVRENPVACKRMLAYIPDNPDIYDHLTGMQYIRFVADIFGVSEEARKGRIDRYAKAFEMERELNGLISEYSHGMKQKTSLIAALVHAPKLLVLDEPFVGLDPVAAHTLKTIMGEITASGGAIFFSTHVLDVAEKLCNRIAIIKNGSLVADGETATVKGNASLEDVFLELIEK
ncbi:MAG: ABC transporter ATP-binding protein [Clostridiaceae bacterium]|nr:ABC transporter ATP-binding protein [Eubacteriales bacterium]